MDTFLSANDVISASLADCYVIIDKNRYSFMQAINLEAKIEKEKTQIAVLGKTGKLTKSKGWKGTGKATFHYNTSIFRDLLQRYKNTGKDVFFEIQVANEDTSSSIGRQSVVLKNCNINSGIIAKFDTKADFLDETLEFTFDDFEIQSKFGNIPGMLS